MTVPLVFLVGIVGLLGLLVAAEIAMRARQGFREGSLRDGQYWQVMKPFTMFATVPTSHFEFDDIYRGTKVTLTARTNNEGFMMDEDVRLGVPVAKRPDERVVLFTGGSAAWGVGASTADHVISHRMEHKLNASQNRYRYKVVNLAMGSWIAYQEFLALSMWGRNFEADWVVVMDGTNDAATTCAHSQGAGHPMYYALMESYIQGYLFGQWRPSFYRGWIENQLVKHSLVYRRLSGKGYVARKWLIDDSDPTPGRFAVREVPWEEIETAVQFYLQTHGMVLDLFPKANVLMSSQPLPFDFGDMFGATQVLPAALSGAPMDPAERAEHIAVHERALAQLFNARRGTRCGQDAWPDGRTYFMARSALELERLARRSNSEPGRHVGYLNAGRLFPNTFEERTPFFIDPVHLNDQGMETVASAYAYYVLRTDMAEGLAAAETAA